MPLVGRMSLDEFVGRALRVPYVAGGRNLDGWDCWGLIVRAYELVADLALPEYSDRAYGQRDLDAFYREELTLSWRRRRGAAHALDLAIFRIDGRPVHSALCLDGRRFLHANEGVGTVVERLDALPWSQRLEGVYRWAV